MAGSPTAPSGVKVEIKTSKLNEVQDPQGLVVVLEKDAWEHITDGHPEMRDRLDDVMQAIKAPTFIQSDPIDPDSRRYYWLKPTSFGKYSQLYLMVVVGVDNESVNGRVRTAHLIEMPKRGTVLWVAKK